MSSVRLVFAATLLLAVSACGAPPRPESPPADQVAKEVTALADNYVKAYFSAFPYQALIAGAPDAHPDQLVDHSLPAMAKWREREDAMLGEIEGISLRAIDGRPEAITFALLKHQLEASARYRPCRMELWNVSPTYTGWQADFAVAAESQPTGTDSERRNVLARFSQLPKYLDNEIANLQEGLRLGFLAPRHNVVTVIGQMDAMLKAPVGDSPFVAMATSATPPEFRAELEKLETTAIRPAIKRYRDFLQQTYLPKARTAIGVSANPNGAACYLAAVQMHATVAMKPEEINALGRAQILALQNEIKEIGARSFGTSDPVAVLKLVREDPKYRFTSRDELIAYARAAVERSRLAVPKFFGRVPAATVVVEPFPAYLEKSAPGGFYVPPSAPGQSGTYKINAYEAEKQSRAGVESTAFHEGYPGHHLQGALALERDGLHPIARYFYLSGFGEGWGLYSERLADEMGLYSSDVDRLGQLANESLRAARLVVDSGMHALGMSRAEAIDYLIKHTTETPSHAAAEIDRYIATPGQATAYMIGNLEIRKLRNEAQQALGSKFDVKAFHDVVLADGTLPLWLLRQNVERWVASRK